MDGNGKIGLLGKQKSRNGKHLESVFEEQCLEVINRSEKCMGKVTRQSTTNENEKSAIDFVVADHLVNKDIELMMIDEAGDLKIKGLKSTDHNTITVNLRIKGTERHRQAKKTKWRLNAPEASWAKLRHEIKKLGTETEKNCQSTSATLDQKYAKWLKGLETAAGISIGKTTIKQKTKERFSEEIKDLRDKKKEIKQRLNSGNGKDNATKSEYKDIQEKIRNQILLERTKKTNEMFEKMTQDKSSVVLEGKEKNRSE